MSINLKGGTISYAVVVKGKAFAKNTASKTNGRVQAGLPLIPDSEGCYQLAYSSATGSYFWLDVVCGQGDGSTDPSTAGNGNQTGGAIARAATETTATTTGVASVGEW